MLEGRLIQHRAYDFAAGVIHALTSGTRKDAERYILGKKASETMDTLAECYAIVSQAANFSTADEDEALMRSVTEESACMRETVRDAAILATFCASNYRYQGADLARRLSDSFGIPLANAAMFVGLCKAFDLGGALWYDCDPDPASSERPAEKVLRAYRSIARQMDQCVTSARGPWLTPEDRLAMANAK